MSGTAGGEEVAVQQTYWRRVRYDSDRPPWVLKEIPGKGMAAFATRSFKQGDLIYTEFPAVWIHGHHPFNEEQVEEIHAKVNALDATDQAAFYAMANVFPHEEFPPAVGIFMTNCFDMTDSVHGVSCAMYLALARLNHSCVPNVQQTHLPETTEEVVYASRDIAVGEEMNDCYIDLRQARSGRRKELLEYYRFFCTCAACGDGSDSSRADSDTDIVESLGIENLEGEMTSTQQSSEVNEVHSQTPDALSMERIKRDDSLRTTAGDLFDRVVSYVEAEDGDCTSAIAYLTTVLTTLETAPSTLWSVRYLSEIYRHLHQLYTAQGARYRKAARAALVTAYRYSVLLEGPRSPQSLSLQELVLSEVEVKRSGKVAKEGKVEKKRK